MLARRHFLQTVGTGVGSAALLSLLNENAAADVHTPPFPARARSVIYIHLVGAPSHLDLFDPKPELRRRSGQLCPDEFFAGKKLAFIREQPSLFGTPSQWKFGRGGESGLEISDLLPNLRGVAEELCLFKTVHTTQFNHAPAQLMLLTGFERFGRPSVGSWVSYGLGSENGDLPAFVVMTTGLKPGAGASAWGSGFLPTRHQGVEFRGTGDPVLFLSDPPGMTRRDRGAVVDAVNRLNRVQLADVGDPEIATRIAQYELAFRMQTAVPDLVDTSDETAETHALYGSAPGEPSFARNCLLARRLVERGVRFVQLFDQGWDHHGNLLDRLPAKCRQVDRPIAGLIADLKRRGLLDDTLVVWGTEFGRTPMAQTTGGGGENTKTGRDHHNAAFTLWTAGGGTRGGTAIGSTDDLGYGPADRPVHLHDFNATLLHLLGFDHERLTFRHAGRDFRLTDVHGEVVREALA